MITVKEAIEHHKLELSPVVQQTLNNFAEQLAFANNKIAQLEGSLAGSRYALKLARENAQSDLTASLARVKELEKDLAAHKLLIATFGSQQDAAAKDRSELSKHIAELEAQVRSMRRCINCKRYDEDNLCILEEDEYVECLHEGCLIHWQPRNPQ